VPTRRANPTPSRTRADAAPARQTTKVLLKGLAVLERIAAAPGDVGVSEVSRDLALDKATIFRLLSTLCAAGYVERVDPAGRYRLTARLGTFARGRAASRSLMEIALPHMRELAAEADETAYVAVLNGHEAIFLDKVESGHALRVHTPNGSRIPLHCGSAAKALLAWQPAELIDHVAQHLTAVTPHSITSAAALRRDLAAIRARGYAIGEQEWRVGVSGVGAPVHDPSGQVVAALAISGPSSRVTRRRLQALGVVVVRHADRLSHALGWRAS
jgi:IclR family transcriptional regulator, KDG regulon repressor